MCKFKSGIILKNGDVIMSPNTDHHSDLLHDNNINDDTVDPSKKSFARFEFIPHGGLLDFGTYNLTIDEQVIPKWLTGYKRNKAKAVIVQWCKDNITNVFEGDLYLSHTNITSLPDNLSVGGYLDLSHTNITSLPDNLRVSGSLDLSHTNITSLPDNLSVGGTIYKDF